MGFPGGSVVKNLPVNEGNEGLIPEKMTIHSSILAWEIPWTERPGLQSMGLQKSQT